VNLTYLVEADVEEERTRLTLPTTLAPRYCPPTHRSPQAATISGIRHTDSSPPLSLKLDVFAKSPIVSLSSPSHSLVTSEGEIEDGLYHKEAHFKGTTVDMDRDVVVLVATEAGHCPRLLIEKGENSTAVLLTLVPRLEDLVTVPSEVVFLIDCSGSMGGQSISMAKEALSLLLNSLPTDSTFNIIRFGSTMELLFPSSQPYTDSTLEKARALVEKLKADLGGTQILPPLQAIFNQPREESQRLKQLFILTDGEVSNSGECIRLVGAERKKTRVFTLGIGSSADRHLVKGLARAGGGTSAFTSEGEQLARKVVRQLSQALAPSLYPVTVDWGLQGEGEGTEHCQVPRLPPPIFHGSRFSLFRLFAGDVKVGGKVVLKAGETEQELEVESKPRLAGELLHKMFARRMIQELEEETEVGETEIELIKELSLKYNIISRFTSFVGVDEGSSEAKEGVGEMLVRRVDNMIPHQFAGFTAHCLQPALQCYTACASYTYDEFGDNDSECDDMGLDGWEEVEDYADECLMLSPRIESFLCARTVGPGLGGGGSRISQDQPDACEEEEDDDMGLEEFSVSFSSSSSKGRKDKGEGKERTLHEKMMDLMTLQTASGHFAENKMIGDIIGKPLEDLKAQVPDSNPDSMKSWITAIVVAFLELRCLEEKDLWQMSVNKARATILDLGSIEKAKEIIAQF